MRVRRKASYQAIEPDEILIDAANLPAFDTARLEGKIERPIGEGTFRGFLIVLALAGALVVFQLLNLQVREHEAFAARAEANRLTHTLILAERGRILDRTGAPLAENVPGPEEGLATRAYSLGEAAAALVGYVSYPKLDSNGFWYQDATVGVAGAEQVFDNLLLGKNGLRISETDASGDVVSGAIVRNPEAGRDVLLSVDAALTRELYDAIRARATASHWQGGAGAIMDIRTGELLALASYPSFDPSMLSSGEPTTVAALLTDPRSPLLDRAVQGLYTPGSVVKPFIATAALEEGVIDPEKEILSTGSISVPNPYDPEHPSVFRDWREQGWVDMRLALAYSSDVYFYEVGGGFQNQRGLGIAAIDEYMERFGFGAGTGSALPGEVAGTIPTPEWKAATFDGEPWYLGNTYHTAIGQYGFQATILELVRATAALANGGTLVTPVIEAGVRGAQTEVGVSQEHLAVVREGMRLAVTSPRGTAQALSVPGLSVAGKTGTAEVGVKKESINSLTIGFFPYEEPRYAFAVVMERAKAGTGEGAPAVMREVLSWLTIHADEVLMVDATGSGPHNVSQP